MKLTEDVLTFTDAPVQPPVEAEWYHRIVKKRAERKALLPPVGLSAAELNAIASSEKHVRDVPFKRGLLDRDVIDITDTSPRKLLKRLATAEISAEQVLRAFIIRATIAQELTNALSEVMFDYGIAQAKHLDDVIKRTGKPVGPLHGLPISIKDVFNVEGFDTTAGWAALIGKPATSTSRLVQKLQEAGAVIYCKTNVPRECVNYVFGRTTTPFNTTLSAGGSSGGEGALVSMGGSPIGIGTDIAGSIRTPANFCGVYGLTPTAGRLPYDTKVGFDAIKAVHGPLSRSVEGLEVYVQALLATSPWDWDQATTRMPWRAAEYEEGLAMHRPLVLGVMRHDGVVTPHPPIQRSLEETVKKLRSAGHVIVEVEPFKTQEIMDTMMTLFGCEGEKTVQPFQSILNEPLISEIDAPTEKDALSAWQYCQLNQRKLRLRQEFHDYWLAQSLKAGTGKIDAFVLPSGGHVAPPHGSMTYLAYEAIPNFLDLPCATYPVDVVLPTDRAEQSEFKPMSPADTENWGKYTPEAYANGPVSMQVMGERFGEEKLLGILRAFDQAFGRSHDFQI